MFVLTNIHFLYDYRFNRTGFFICCYMIERLGVSVPDALRYFADARPPGIR